MPLKAQPPPKPPPKPRSNVQRHKPLRHIPGTASSPGLPQFRASTPIRATTPARSPTPGPVVRRCANPNCLKPEIIMMDDGQWVCHNCGAIAQIDPQLVSEQQFTEERGGRITAQGQTVAHDQTHQRTYGAQPRAGKAGQEQSLSYTRARSDARSTMATFCQPLNVPQSEVEAGLTIWNLAYKANFVQGRGLSNVATVCFFLALRRRTEQVEGHRRAKYPIMLIDFAEISNVDVFTLGRMYTDLVRTLYLDTATGYKSSEALDLLAHGPEVLVDRFVESLEFPPQSARNIKADAIRIVSRMKRDWMTTGRRPAGVCGAAVILAARMNNHRRSTREVVLTAKVTEITLNKRLEEFSETKSSQLSVLDFRDAQKLSEVAASDPPAYTRACNPPKPKKRKRKGGAAPETAAEIEGEDEQENPEVQSASKRTRVDAEGFAIPALPSRSIPGASAATKDSSTGTNRKALGRPAGTKNWRAPPTTPAEQAIEDEIQRDIDLTLEENPELNPTSMDEDDVIDPGEKIPRSVLRKLEEVRALSREKGNTNTISLEPEIGRDEFEDDEEVAICILTEPERQMKEIVWVTANADWLRQEHAKKIKRELKIAEITAMGGDPSLLDKPKARKDGKLIRKDGLQRSGRGGDTSYLRDDDRRRRQESIAQEGGDAEGNGGDAEGGEEEDRSRTRSPSGSPFPVMRSTADTVHLFMQQRSNAFSSRRLNRDAIEQVYTFRRDSSSTPSDSRSPTQARKSGSLRHEDVIFGGVGAKDTGLIRSRSSWSAEKREAKKKKQQSREGSGGSGNSVSTSPEAESERGRPGSATNEDATASPTPGPSGTSRPHGQALSRSQPTSQPHTPTSTQHGDGSVEEVVGSNPVSRSVSDTPGPRDGLITLRDDVEMDDEDEDEDEDENDDEDEDDDEDEPEVEPEDLFAGRAPSRRR